MKVRDLSICLDCDEVFEMKEHSCCPSCCSRESFPISGWLDKPIDKVIPAKRELLVSAAHSA